MHIVYTDAHQLHQPRFELYDGVETPHAEVAARADTIIHTVRERNIGKIMQPKHWPKRHIYAVHQPQYVDTLRRWSVGLLPDNVLYPSYFMSDTYAPVTAGTYEASRRAADAALTGAELLLNGERTVYSLCRPPGHHAGQHQLGGYCYFNNAAIAAEYLSQHGRVAILDIDYHHGNGTQEIFYDRDDVLYISLHADPNHAYPYSTGFANETGRGAGLGYTYNIPLARSTTDHQYLRHVTAALRRIEVFNPDVLVVSAGFDTFVDDPIGGLQLSQGVYGQIGARINRLGLPTLIVQEGGYNVAALGTLVADFLESFTP